MQDMGDGNELEKTTKRVRRKTGVVVETTVSKRELTGDKNEEGAGEDDGGRTFANIFDTGGDDEDGKTIDRVRIIRSEPHEGFLGYLTDLETTEQDILEKWGGSTYRCEGINTRGRLVKVRTLRLAGDPIFVSQAAETQWRKQKGLPPSPITGVQQGPDVQTILTMLEEQRQREAKERDERENRERQEREERESRRRQEEREFKAEQDRLAREAEERRRREEMEREERRRADERERDERRRRDLEESTQRSQQFMTQMLTILQQSNAQSITFLKDIIATNNGKPAESSTDVLLKGIDIALKLRSGAEDGEEDVLSTVVKSLPDILNSAGGAVGKAINEVRGNRSAPEGGFVLRGPAAEKMSALAARIQEAGGDPEQALATIADRLMQGPAAAPAKVAAPAAPAVVENDAPTPPRPVVFDTPPVEASPAPAPAQTTRKPGVVRMPIGKKHAA